MRVEYEFYEKDFEVIANMSRDELADRIIDFANKLRTNRNTIKNLKHIQNIVDSIVVDIDPELV